MTTTTKVAIGVAALAALAGGGYYAYKKFGPADTSGAAEEPMCEVGGLDAEDTVTTVDLNEATPGVE